MRLEAGLELALGFMPVFVGVTGGVAAGGVDFVGALADHIFGDFAEGGGFAGAAAFGFGAGSGGWGGGGGFFGFGHG